MSNSEKDDLRQEYDLKSLGKGIRGKYYEQYKRGTNVVVIDPELSKEFPTTQDVNDALRRLLEREKREGT